MAFAIVANSTKIFPVEGEVALRGQAFLMALQFQLTAANADAGMDLGVVAAADVSGQGAAITTLLAESDYIISSFVLESARAAAAAGSAHTLTGTAAAPVFTYAGGGTTPTTQTYSLIFRLAKDKKPMIYGL